MHEASSDGNLFERYRRGDMRAFDALYARYRAPLYNFLLRQSGRRRQDVDEVFQETWLKVIRNAHSYDPAQAFAPWLYRITRNCLVDRWRYLAVVESIHVADDIAMLGAASDGLLQPERLAASDDIRTRWDNALRALPALQREAVLLKLEADFDLDELASITGANRETVKSRLRYGMTKLRELLGGLSVNEVVDE